MLAEERHDCEANHERKEIFETDSLLNESLIVKPIKSYDNTSWMHSRGAREVRILCEYLEVRDRLHRHRILCTFLVFGSARCYNRNDWNRRFVLAQSDLKSAETREEIVQAERAVEKLKRVEWLCNYWEKIRCLSARLMTWVHTEEARVAVRKILKDIPSPVGGNAPDYITCDLSYLDDPSQPSPVAMCTGGGPGIMEAANCGAAGVPLARSVGMGISLPFEPGLNQYVDSALSFEFHYFFTRKFWMVYSTIGVIAAPGGVGTLDELMEILTLKQSKKLKRDIPVVLFGKQFWKDVINFDKLVEYGTLSGSDCDQFLYTDDVEEAFQFLRSHIIQDKLLLGPSHIHKSLRRGLHSP